MVDSLLYAPIGQTAQQDEIVANTLRLFSELQLARVNYNSQWNEVAALILPEQRDSFYVGSYSTPGAKKTQQQIDATGMLALQRFGAILDSLLTPANMRWHKLGTNNPSLNKNRKVALWFEAATDVLFAHRYAPHANYMGNQHMNYLGLGAFGTQAMFVDQYSDPVGHRVGLRYRSVPIGELFIYVNHQNQIIGAIRYFRMTARAAYLQFPERFPEALRAPLEKGSETLFEFLHHICLNEKYDPEAFAHKQKGKPWQSHYISMTGRALLDEGGYRSWPLPCGRYLQFPNQTYGTSPAMMVLPALKTANAQKRTFLKQAHRAADPVLLLADDGLIDSVDLRPGALNRGGVSADGRPLVHALPTGDIQVSEKMMEIEQTLINDAFLVTLFQILTESPQMTATEVIERTNEKGILLAPGVGRQAAEYLGGMIERELDILSFLKVLPEMPRELIEASGEYDVIYTSPLSRAMRAQEAAGFMRTLESAMQVANASGDPSQLDSFNFDVAWPEIAEIQAVPVSWMRSPQEIMIIKKQRADAAHAKAQLDALPNLAAMKKADAAAAKAGIPDPNQPGAGGGALQPAPQGQPSFQPGG